MVDRCSILSLKIKITCPNWRETAQFYRDHFAMETVEEWDEPDYVSVK